MKIVRLGAFALVLAVGACASQTSMPGPSLATGDAKALQRTYRLGIGDKLKVSVFGEENLSGQVEVNPRGTITLPLVGEVVATGLSVDELRDGIVRKLSDGYLKSPKVTVEVLNYRPIYVHGEVKNGGEFAYKSGLRIRDAIATAGGFTYRADQTYVVIVREGAEERRIQSPGNVPVLPGDNILIPERFF